MWFSDFLDLPSPPVLGTTPQDAPEGPYRRVCWTQGRRLVDVAAPLDLTVGGYR